MKQSNTRILATEKHNLCGLIDWKVIKFFVHLLYTLPGFKLFLYSAIMLYFKNIPVVYV